MTFIENFHSRLNASDHSPARKPYKIIIADHHSVVRFGLANIVHEHWKHVNIGFADNFSQVISHLADPVDLLISEINIPDGNTFQMIDSVKRKQQGLKILFFSSYNEMVYAARYLEAGASGYLPKESSPREIVQAIQTVLSGGKYTSSQLGYSLLASLHGTRSLLQNPINALSNRELEVGMLLQRGLGLLEISNKLNLQIGTVSTYKKRLFEKLDINTIAELKNMFEVYC